VTTVLAMSNSIPENIVARIEALEIKASFADDAIDKLDQVIIRQQLQIDYAHQRSHRSASIPITKTAQALRTQLA
jgi:hypothetical protein